MYGALMRLMSLFLSVLVVACEETPAKTPEPPPPELQRATGTDLPPTRVSPCYSAPNEADATAPSYEHIVGVALSSSDVQSCVDESKTAGEVPNGATTFLVSVGLDDHISSVEVLDSCGISTHSVMCFGQAFQHARVDPQAQLKKGTLTLTFGNPHREMRGSSSEVGYTTVHDFTIHATDVFMRARPTLDTCARAASARGKYEETWAQFSLQLDADGKVREIQVDPFAGNQALLGCAAEALQKLAFPPPPRGADIVREHLSFEAPPSE